MSGRTLTNGKKCKLLESYVDTKTGIKDRKWKLFNAADQLKEMFMRQRLPYSTNAVSACQQPGAISPKPLCPAVVMSMREIFLLQSKCPVAKMCKIRCPAVDLSNLLSQNKCRVGKVCKNRSLAVDISNFLSQNKCRVGKVYKNRCPTVDLANFCSKISAG